MKSVAISLALGLAAGVATLAVAQDKGTAPFSDRPTRGGFTQEDRAAFTEGRIAGLKATLKLTAEQEKLWAPVEGALRDLAKQRADAWAQRRERWASMRESRAAGQPVERNVPEELRARADRLSEQAASMRKLADASAPLYAALDEGQKRRLGVVMRMAGSTGMRGHRQGWRNG